MKRVAVILLVVLAAGAGGPGRNHAAFAKPVPAYAVLALVDESPQTKLAWLDPRTLKRIQTDAVAVGEGWAPVLSPAKKKVAVGGPATRGLRIVDLSRMKVLARIAKRKGAWSLTPLAWTQARRLFVLEFDGGRTHAQNLLVVDPVARRVIRRTALDGFGGWAAAGSEVVWLADPAEGIGPARLLVADGDGAIRSLVLDRIPAGGVQEGSAEEPTWRTAAPGLAVDPAGRWAYVVGEAPLVAVIDLESLTVEYRELSRPVPLLGRLRAWLEPKAEAKVVTGWSRQVVWLGDGLLAVSGSDYDRLRRVPAGLELIDVPAGTLRRLEDRASFVLTTGSLLLAAGATNDSGGDAWYGMGVAAYTIDGLPRWQAIGGEPVSWLQAAGGYAYVAGPEVVPPMTVRVIDLATGAVRTVRRQMPVFVTPP